MLRPQSQNLPSKHKVTFLLIKTSLKIKSESVKAN